MISLKAITCTLLAISALPLLNSCGSYTPPPVRQAGNLGTSPTTAERRSQIANEERGNFYYARRYYVEKTRLWGYIRQPGKSWKTAKLVLIVEDIKHQPDRFPEEGKGNKRFGFDQNFEYKFYGSFTGENSYDPNSNLFLPKFLLTDYKLVNEKPGWIFSPNDYYDPKRVTLRRY